MIEEIEASAIKYPWGEVVVGFRHSDIMKFMAQRRIRSGVRCTQGFITSTGRFLDREQAAAHARIVSKQVSEEHRGELYSEDLWDGDSI